MKLKAVLPLMLFSAIAGAEEYTSFSSASYQNKDYDFGAETDQYDINSRYFFGPKETLGPLKEFEYINKVSNLYGGFSRIDYENDDASGATIGGEAFIGQFMLGARFSNFETDAVDIDSNTLSVGYLFTDNFLVKLDSTDADGMDERYNVISASYNHQLGGSDYIGFTVSTDDDVDSTAVSSKYLRSLAGDSYLVLEGGIVDEDEGDSVWNVGAEYYFTKMTSVGFSTIEGDANTLDFTHFFNRSIAANLAYTQQDGDYPEADTIMLGLTAQF